MTAKRSEKLNFTARHTIQRLQALISQIKAQDLIPIEMRERQHVEKADFGAVCPETHLGDTFRVELVAVIGGDDGDE